MCTYMYIVHMFAYVKRSPEACPDPVSSEAWLPGRQGRGAKEDGRDRPAYHAESVMVWYIVEYGMVQENIHIDRYIHVYIVVWYRIGW